MQLLNICTNAIALFGAAYFIIALAAHLQHCWEHPPAKLEPSTMPLLLPPAPELHPFEMSLEKMPHIEAIAALPSPAADILQAVAFQTLELISHMGENDVPHIEPDAPIDYQGMSSQQLRKFCGDRGIRWRGVKAGKHLTKPEMVAALS